MKPAFVLPVVVFLTTALAFPQNPPKHVEQALRARVEEFYQLQVDKKFREAEKLVADDTKDYYYTSKKASYKSFRIDSIVWSPDFRSAKVTVAASVEMFFPGAGVQVLDLKFPSAWKIDHKLWSFHVDSDSRLDTPFGRMKPNTSAQSNPMATFAAVSSVKTTLEFDPREIHLDAAHPTSVTINLRNALPGPLTIQTPIAAPGLDLVLTKSNLEGNESAQITLKPIAGETDRPRALTMTILPTGETVSIPIVWAPEK